MKVYASYEISPVIEVEGACEVVGSVNDLPPDERSQIFWNIYGRWENGETVEVIGDFDSYRAAVTVYERITGLRAPKRSTKTVILPASSLTARITKKDVLERLQRLRKKFDKERYRERAIKKAKKEKGSNTDREYGAELAWLEAARILIGFMSDFNDSPPRRK